MQINPDKKSLPEIPGQAFFKQHDDENR